MPDSNSRKYIITGSPGTGKTSLVDYLDAEGFTTYPEIARQIIKEQLELGTDIVPWKKLDAFSHHVLERMLHMRSEVDDSNLAFFDRGIPDIMAYLHFGNYKIDKHYFTAVKNYNYNRTAFVAPPWEEIYEQDNERRESYQDALDLHDKLVHMYEGLGFEVHELPKKSIEERAGYLLDIIGYK